MFVVVVVVVVVVLGAVVAVVVVGEATTGLREISVACFHVVPS